jgi:hypothetical protein
MAALTTHVRISIGCNLKEFGTVSSIILILSTGTVCQGMSFKSIEIGKHQSPSTTDSCSMLFDENSPVAPNYSLNVIPTKSLLGVGPGDIMVASGILPAFSIFTTSSTLPEVWIPTSYFLSLWTPWRSPGLTSFMAEFLLLQPISGMTSIRLSSHVS